jgi:hypothetical protein
MDAARVGASIPGNPNIICPPMTQMIAANTPPRRQITNLLEFISLDF